MEVEYKREMNRNYMVVQPEPGHIDRYTIRMISGNQISGLLPFQEKWFNGELRHYYDITSKQPLGRLLEYRTMSGPELQGFVSGFLNAIKQMERFLLDENQICLHPEYLYVDSETFQCALLIQPGKYYDFIEEFRGLCQYLLDHVNQSDAEAVMLAFSVLKVSQRGNFGLEDIESCLQKNRKKEESKEEEDVSPISEEDIYRKEEEEKIPEPVSMDLKKQKRVGIGLWGVLMVSIPMVLVVLGGLDLLHRFKFPVIGVEILLLGGMLLVPSSIKNGNVKNGGEEEDLEPVYEDSIPKFYEERWEKDEKKPLSEENLQTVLLTAKPIGEASRYLVPMGGGEAIAVHYFPYLIGKNRGIVDLYLNEPGISRLHAKLEEQEGSYYVTDLNSTNGIMVDGVWLQTNERRLLPVGSEIILATSRFRFQ